MLLQIKVKKETIKKTTKCEKNFACLSSKNQVCCKVEYRINGSVLFINCFNKGYCNYKMFLGDSFICNCHTRKKIFSIYGI